MTFIPAINGMTSASPKSRYSDNRERVYNFFGYDQERIFEKNSEKILSGENFVVPLQRQKPIW